MTEPTPMAQLPSDPGFFAAGQAEGSLLAAGFRVGERGTHTSRTMMFAEIEALLDAVPVAGRRQAYAAEVMDANVLAKPTAATRRASLQRLRELYALDPAVPIFAALRYFWSDDPQGRPLLALLTSLARDPLLRATAPAVLAHAPGEQLPREALELMLRRHAGERLGPGTLAKVARNAASTWTQSGHLRGRTFKFRQRVEATPAAAALAIYFAGLAGVRGRWVWECAWMAALDLTPTAARDLTLAAHRMGILTLRMVGDLPEFAFPGLQGGRQA